MQKKEPVGPLPRRFFFFIRLFNETAIKHRLLF